MTFIDEYNTVTPRYPEMRGQVALVTGSGRGIGKGIAARLGREGLRVALSDQTEEALAPALAEFQAAGADALGFAADLSLPGEPVRLMQSVLDRFGQIDVLVNNAADLRQRPLADISEEFLDYEIAVNFKAPFLLAQGAAEAMRRQRREGSILFISSVGGLRAHRPGLPYDALKSALDSTTRALALDLAPDGIRVNAVAPGLTASKQNTLAFDPAVLARIPLNRAATIYDIAAAVAYLISPDGAYITGQVLYIDGGLTAQLTPDGAEV